MLHVLIALVPCVIAGIYRFGFGAALLLAISMCTAMLAELIFQKLAKKPVTTNDLSALLTGLIVGLNLPPQAPWWLAVVGSAFAIILVKQLFGGIGDNFMNPAMAARAVLLASWPVHMTKFIAPINGNFGADVISGATQLTAINSVNSPLTLSGADLFNHFTGNIPGAIGEVSKAMIVLGLVYLLLTRVITWHIPVTMVASAALMSLILGGDPLSNIVSGGLLFGAVYMATDYTTSPMTKKGQVIFGAGCGIFVCIIRKYGAYPEGVTYAILFMNCLTPLLDKFIRPRVYGAEKKQKEAKADA
jgi:electron transport complex protein RnfD